MNQTPFHSIRGSVMGMLTPFTHDEQLDLPSLRRYTQALVSAGQRALVFSPMVSSLIVQSPAEQLAAAAETKQAAGDRALVLPTTRGDSPAETVAFLRDLEKHQVDGVFIYPAYLAPYPDLYIDLLKICCQATSLPILAFQVAVEFDRRFGGIPWMTLDHWARVAELPQIVGLKDDTGNLDLRRNFSQRFNDRFLYIGPGNTDRYMQVHHLPRQAELNSIAFLNPAHDTRFHELIAAGDIEGAQAMFARSSQTVQRIRKDAATTWPIHALHLIAHARGWFNSPAMRKPLPPSTPHQIEITREHVRQYDSAA